MDTERTPVITTTGLRKTYGKGENAFHALQGIDISINKQESVAIVGKSGSGKSTLMHILALLDTPDQGTINVNGTEASKIKGQELNMLRNSTFGFVFQQFFLNPQDTVLENVMLPLLIAGKTAKESKKIAMEKLALVDLADKAKNRATALSGGQKQRTVIARALANNPDIIFADEPTGNLDGKTSVIIEDILFGLQREQGITLVIVTHDDDLAAKCDRIIRVSDGVVVAIEEKSKA